MDNMVISSFYNTAKSYAEKIKAEMPSVFEKEDFTITLIMAEEDQQIFTGVTTYTISEGNVDTIHSEAIAVMSMIAANKPKAKQMITVSFSDLKVVKPCDECLDMLLGADADNGKCEIAINFSNSETAINLKSQATNISADFLEKNTEEEVSVPDLGAPAEFVSGFEFDADNPFLAESEEAVEEVKTIASEAAKKPVQQRTESGSRPRPLRTDRSDAASSEDMKAQEMLISLFASGQIPKDMIEEKDFDDDELKSLYRELAAGASPASLPDLAPDDVSRSRYTRLLLSPTAGTTDEMIAMATDCLTRIRKTRLEKRYEELSQEISSASGDRLPGLLKEVQEISDKLKKLK